MKKLTAISFLGIFLLANTEMGQLLKLPVLVHHYLEHHEDDAGTSLVDFLHKHYDEESTHPYTNHEHEKLPFKSHECSVATVGLVNPPLVIFEFTNRLPLITRINYSEGFYSSSILSRIWQPPRTC